MKNISRDIHAPFGVNVRDSRRAIGESRVPSNDIQCISNLKRVVLQTVDLEQKNMPDLIEHCLRSNVNDVASRVITVRRRYDVKETKNSGQIAVHERGAACAACTEHNKLCYGARHICDDELMINYS